MAAFHGWVCRERVGSFGKVRKLYLLPAQHANSRTNQPVRLCRLCCLPHSTTLYTGRHIRCPPGGRQGPAFSSFPASLPAHLREVLPTRNRTITFLSECHSFSGSCHPVREVRLRVYTSLHRQSIFLKGGCSPLLPLAPPTAWLSTLASQVLRSQAAWFHRTMDRARTGEGTRCHHILLPWRRIQHGQHLLLPRVPYRMAHLSEGQRVQKSCLLCAGVHFSA